MSLPLQYIHFFELTSPFPANDPEAGVAWALGLFFKGTRAVWMNSLLDRIGAVSASLHKAPLKENEIYNFLGFWAACHYYDKSPSVLVSPQEREISALLQDSWVYHDIWRCYDHFPILLSVEGAYLISARMIVLLLPRRKWSFFKNTITVGSTGTGVSFSCWKN